MFFNVLCELIIFAGLALTLKKPIVGIVLVLLGVGLFVLVRKSNRKEPQRVESKSRTYRIARINYFEKELMEFAEEREEYEYSAQRIVEEHLDKNEIFRYKFPRFGKLAKDPYNEHDKNAVMVLMNGECIGFIPAEDAVEVGELLDTRKVVETVLDIDGGPFKRYDPDTERITIDTVPFHGEVTIVYER